MVDNDPGEERLVVRDPFPEGVTCEHRLCAYNVKITGREGLGRDLQSQETRKCKSLEK